MGLCARSRGSAFVRVHGGCVWFHSSRTSDTWPRHTRFVRLSLSPSSTSFFHPLIGTLNPNNGAEKTEKASPAPLYEIAVAMLQPINWSRFVRSIVLSPSIRDDNRFANGRSDYPFLLSANRIIISSPPDYPPFHFSSPPLVSLFSCLASRSINRSHL